MRRSKKLKSAESTGSHDEQSEETGNIVYSLETNPLNIPPVLQHLFKVMDYQTLKECRLVSSKWKDVSDLIFIERSLFAFENKTTTKIPKAMQKSPVKIFNMQQIFGSMEGAVNFSAFKFQHDLLTGPAKKMYFDPNKSKMTHLEIKNVGTKAAPRTSDGNNFDRWIAPHLKKIIVSSARWKDRAFALSLERLAGISHIKLSDGELIGSFSGEVKLSPKELILRRIYLQTSLEFVEVAGFVDFRYLQVLHLDSMYREGQTPFLNFSYCANIKTLILIGMKINLDGLISPRVLELKDNSYYVDGDEVTYDSPCFINDYILKTGTHFNKMVLHCDRRDKGKKSVTFDFGDSISVDTLMIEKTRFIKTENNSGGNKIKDLKIIEPIFQNKADDEDIGKCGIDLSCLSSSLEILTISKTEEHKFTFPIFSSGDVCFPKLAHLLLSGCKGEGADGKRRNEFALFSNCPLLADVILFGFCGALFSDDDDAFPALKRLVLWDVTKMTFDFDNTNLIPKPRNLDLLVLPSSSLYSGSDFLFEVFANFQAKLVIFLFKNQVNEKNIKRLIRIKQTMHLENIAFGPVEWETADSFKKSLLFRIVNTKAEFYLLEGNGGKAISKDQLLEMIPSNIHDTMRYLIE